MTCCADCGKRTPVRHSAELLLVGTLQMFGLPFFRLILPPLSGRHDRRKILLRCRGCLSFGIGDLALSWFQSYLTGSMQHVRLGARRLSVGQVFREVQQGSLLWLTLSLFCVADPQTVIELPRIFMPTKSKAAIQSCNQPSAAARLQSHAVLGLHRQRCWLRVVKLPSAAAVKITRIHRRSRSI